MGNGVESFSLSNVAPFSITAMKSYLHKNSNEPIEPELGDRVDVFWPLIRPTIQDQLLHMTLLKAGTISSTMMAIRKA